MQVFQLMEYFLFVRGPWKIHDNIVETQHTVTFATIGNFLPKLVTFRPLGHGNILFILVTFLREMVKVLNTDVEIKRELKAISNSLFDSI